MTWMPRYTWLIDRTKQARKGIAIQRSSASPAIVPPLLLQRRRHLVDDVIDEIEISFYRRLARHLIRQQNHFGAGLLRDAIRQRWIVKIVDQDQRNLFRLDRARDFQHMLRPGGMPGFSSIVPTI